MKLYNSLSKKAETFIPLEEKQVKMYVCGITPYDTTHLGHAFTYISFDVLVRYLKYKGFDVVYTQNVTDINDRDNDILKRAQDQGISWQNLAKFWTDKFLKDMQDLNWIKPDNYLWASTQIPAMTELIERLIGSKAAYKINGGVYLDIQKVDNFGKLSGLDKNKMLTVAKEFDEDLDNPDKRDPLDITLWRPTTENQAQHIPSFDSPFGPGRPGWHLECSAMAISSLGEQIDIHGGGRDLLYPHHESEIAQSEGGTGKIPFAKYWLHTEIVSFEGKKISKSIGNLVMISDLLKKYSSNAIRYLLLSHHYRKPWEFKESELIEAEEKVNKLKQKLNSSPSGQSMPDSNSAIQQFSNFLDDDLNTPKALEILLKSVEAGFVKEVKEMATILGFAISNKP